MCAVKVAPICQHTLTQRHAGPVFEQMLKQTVAVQSRRLSGNLKPWTTSEFGIQDATLERSLPE
eukprot:8638100-Lingulodinium_polyedra.AAC.1